jgi:hypothetical protein
MLLFQPEKCQITNYVAGENLVFLSNELAKIENDAVVCFMDKRIRIIG